MRTRSWVTALLMASLLVANLPAAASARVLGPDAPFVPAALPSAAPTTRAMAVEAFGRLPMSFVSNGGSTGFLARGNGYVVQTTATGASLWVRSARATATDGDLLSALGDRAATAYTAVQMRLVGSDPAASAVSVDQLPGRVNYLNGNDPARWQTNLATFAKVRYPSVYPGIDLVYYGNQRQLEFDFVLSPGADPNLVAMAFEGARDLALTAAGDLILGVNGGALTLRAPAVYQEHADRPRSKVEARYVLTGGSLVRVEVGTYDASRPLIIDPVVEYSTLLGGTQADYGFSIAVDSAGNAYIAGQTTFGFPTTGGAYDPTANGTDDAFVTKLSASGNALVYSTYLGGTASDFALGIAVDSAGSAYITGRTDSTDFPTFGALQPAKSGAVGMPDAFVTKLGPSGSTLVYSTYLGGPNDDRGYAIAVGGDGTAYVTGFTNSATFPVTNGSIFKGGLTDAFVTAINAAGSAAVYSTYLGGSGPPAADTTPRNGDVGRGIAVDGSGNAYVTGFTDSVDFPTTAGALFTAPRSGVNADTSGYGDAFVTKLTPTGTFAYSTYLGGGKIDIGSAIAIDASGNAYVTGGTASFAGSPVAFPTTAGAYDSNYNLGLDAFLSKLNPSGSALLYSTFFGTGARENGLGVATTGAGRAWVMGITGAGALPTVSPTQGASGGGQDAFVALFDTGASGAASLVFSTYLGGSGTEQESGGIAVDSAGNAYVVGVTDSTNFPTTAGALRAGASGVGAEGFVAKISPGTPNLVITAFTVASPVRQGATSRYDWTVTNTGTATARRPANGWTDQAFISTTPGLSGQIGPAGGSVARSDLAPGASYSSVLNVTQDDPPGNYYIVMRTDNSSTVPESNEADNAFAVPITITAAAYVVNTLDDVVDGNGCTAAHCSLREAIIAANATTTPDSIIFSVSGTISPTSPLPAITQPVDLDGAAPGGTRIVLNGSGAGSGSRGLSLEGGGSTIRTLVIQLFGGAGIEILSSGNAVENSYIGTDAAGVRSGVNGGSGIVISVPGNRIGGTTTAQRNVISGNSAFGVSVIGSGTTGNTILGNHIGIGADGASDVTNGVGGINLTTANNTVRGNVISANNRVGPFSHGIMLESAGATGNVVAGNLIGPRADGTGGYPNDGSGVLITNGATNNTIGGTAAADRNVISGNSKYGVHIASLDATGNVVRGNYIGLAADGQTRLGNGLSGVAITGNAVLSAVGNTVRDNVISGNSQYGLKVENAPAPHTLTSNVIGLAADGLTARPNTSSGLYVYLGETPQPAAMDISLNTVSGNGVHGIYLYGIAGATVAGNRIGLGADGVLRGNGADGIVLIKSSGLALNNNDVRGNGTGIVLGLGNVLNVFTGNTVRGNGATGFVLNGDTNLRNTIAAGSISGHSGKGISLIGGANGGIAAPVVTYVNAGDGLNLAGTGSFGNTVAIYADPADEGLQFLGTATVLESGTWQKGGGWAIPDTSAVEAALRARTLVITATQTDRAGNTSEFSTGRGIASVATGMAQHRETPNGTTINTVTLPGAIVTLISPTGVKRRMTADASGNFSFGDLAANTAYVVGYDGKAGVRHYIAGVRFTTDALGGAVIPAPQAVFNRKNHTWLVPFALQNNVPVPDQVWRRGQATWYRFPITPQQQVTIELKGCAFNCDLVVYKDLQQVRAKLLADAQSQVGIRLSSQGDIMADDLDADDLDADDLDADDLDADDLDADDLDADDLDADDLDADDLDADDLDADDLDADDLDADDLDADDLDADDLDAGDGEIYVAVQRKGLRAASLTPGLAPETVVLNTRNLTGYLYVRVAGGSSLSGVFTVTARQTTDLSCVTAPLISRSPSTTFGPAVAGKRSLILTDTAAYGLAGTAKADFLAKLAAFAAHPTVQGQVVDLAGDAGYQQLRADWALARACVAQANLATDAVREVVQRFRAADPSFEYLIQAGGDAVIPFRRVADWAEISRESKYSPPLDALSASEASLVGNTFLSDDFYVGSPIEGPNRTLYLPDVAVGRLVESVAEVTAYIDMYLLAGGVATPARALSSGYDFNLDLASYITAELAARGLAVDSSLVSNTWTSTAWRDTVLNSPLANAFGILSLQGHFSANRLVPADNGQRVLATEIAAVADGRFARALVYSLGCHSGYSIVNADGSIFTQAVAFPEAFLGQGATLVGGTGYQYGETELMKNSEALLALLTNELGYLAPPSGPAYGLNGVPIGKALMYAKRAYMAQTATPRGIDLKVVNVSTVYGSPTMAFRLPNPHARPSTGTLSPGAVTGFTGLTALNVGSTDALSTVSGADGTYFTAGGKTTTAPYRPIAPLSTIGANVNGSVLQGAVFLGGAYTESAFTPRLSVPATEQTGEAPRYANDVFMPVLPVKTNLFDGDAVQVIPFQYRSNAAGTSGTARVFGSGVQARAYWSSRTGPSSAADAPVIRDVSVKVEGAQLVVFGTLRGLSDPGIAEVWLTYTDTTAASRTFASVPMTAFGIATLDPAGTGFTQLYRATLPGAASAYRFLVQAVSGNGRVSAATNNGQLYGLPAVQAPAIDTRAPSVLALSVPATATYRSTITATATLTAAGQALNGKSVTFSLGGSSRTVLTVNGAASATLDVNVTPHTDPYALTAAFAGDATAFGSGDSKNVTVGRAPTVLEGLTASPQYSDGASVARLWAHGLTLNEQPVIITRGGVSVATATDFAGYVRFDTIDFGAGAGASTLTITYPGNTRYEPASATVTVTVRAENATLALTQLGPQPTGAITFTAQVTQAADGSLGDLTRAKVSYTFTPATGAVITATAPVDALGASTIAVTLPAGLYDVMAYVTRDFTSDVVAMSLPVYDASVFITGGGWLTTGPDSFGVPIGSKANLGFVTKYGIDGTTATGNLTVHVKSKTGKDNDTDAQAQANGSLKFKATSFGWLVIAGNGAAFTGTGTVNGTGTYQFRVDIVDDTTDLFVIHIWDPASPAIAGGSYDHPRHIVRGTLGGGSIRINR